MMRCLLLLTISLTLPGLAVEPFAPDLRLKPDDYTVLMAADAKLPAGLKPFQAGAHGKFQLTGWTRPEQVLEWEISVPQADSYSVNVLLRRHGNQPLVVEAIGSGQRLSSVVAASEGKWMRLPFDGNFGFPAGQQRLKLRPCVERDEQFQCLDLLRRTGAGNRARAVARGGP